jgi:hypothetical protein
MSSSTRSLISQVTFAALVATFALACDDSTGGAKLGDRQLTIPLSYLDGESNAGPTDATGSASVDTTTGRVEIVVEGLPKVPGEAYEGWLAGGGESPVSTGVFRTDASGGGASEITLGDLSGTSYTKVVITIEPDPDTDPAPDARHSLAGFIPE